MRLQPIRMLLRAGLLAVALFLAACSAPLGPAPPGSFSIVALPDTQNYTTFDQEIFRGQVQWILDNKDSQKIVFVTHLGDVTENNTKSEWEIASTFMGRLEGVLPYGVAVGNHDILRRRDPSRFSEAFPASRFESFPWYGGSYPGGTNQSSFQTFEAGGMKFLFMHLICNAPDPVLAWARQVLNSHLDRRVIVSTHMFLGPVEEPSQMLGTPKVGTGVMKWSKVFGAEGNSPQQIWEKLLADSPRVFLILSGDQSDYQALHTTITAPDGRKVHAAMSDYGDGSFRIYRFIPSKNRIQAITYSAESRSVVRSTDKVPDPNQHAFSFDYPMSSAN